MRLVALCAAVVAVSAAMPAQASEALAGKYGCLACHVVKGPKTVGPAYADVAKKYAGKKDAVAHLMDKVKKGGSGTWGPVPMPPNPSVPDADLKALVTWVLSIK
ncbi:MAG TPA: c-type cytochrome [Burkholderiales bacterium]|nr:c-type cytochrome [Burkholderiales bacterium]